MQGTLLRGRVGTRDITLPIRNEPMSVIVGLDQFDDEPTVEYTVHEREAMAALSRYSAMRERTGNADAWHAMHVRLSDARLQLTVGMTREEALAAPMVKDLLVAEEIASNILRGMRTPPAPRRCDDVMRSGRVRIPVLRDEI